MLAAADPRNRADPWGDLDEDAGGLLEIGIIRRPTPADLLSAALTGGYRDRAFITALPRWLDRLDRGAPMPCLCGSDFGSDRLPTSYAMLLPHRPDPRHAAVFGICSRCDVRYGENRLLAAAVRERLLRLIWPEAREIDPAAISTEGGRA